MSRRTERVNELIRTEISELIRRRMNDPRVGDMVSVTEVSCSPDFKNARIYVSVMGSDEERIAALEGLRSASGFLRRSLKPRLDLRNIPELSFEIDDSIARGARILGMLREVEAGAPN